jgi:hypothetical protein
VGSNPTTPTTTAPLAPVDADRPTSASDRRAPGPHGRRLPSAPWARSPASPCPGERTACVDGSRRRAQAGRCASSAGPGAAGRWLAVRAGCAPHRCSRASGRDRRPRRALRGPRSGDSCEPSPRWGVWNPAPCCRWAFRNTGCASAGCRLRSVARRRARRGPTRTRGPEVGPARCPCRRGNRGSRPHVRENGQTPDNSCSNRCSDSPETNDRASPSPGRTRSEPRVACAFVPRLPGYRRSRGSDRAASGRRDGASAAS